MIDEKRINYPTANQATKISFKLKTDLKAGGADGTVYSLDPVNNGKPPPAEA
jgi:hypothetical protein